MAKKHVYKRLTIENRDDNHGYLITHTKASKSGQGFNHCLNRHLFHLHFFRSDNALHSPSCGSFDIWNGGRSVRIWNSVSLSGE